MSSIQRILTGLEFVIDPPTGAVNWPAETEDLVRMSLELARVTRSGLAFAAVGRPPEDECDCDEVDQWLELAETQLEQLAHAAAVGASPLEVGAWLGDLKAEWAASARESEMDLLIVPGGSVPESLEDQQAELDLPRKAGCPVWFAGREPDRLDDAPPLIAFCDDLTNEAAKHLLLAVDLAQVWNARLLIVHPVTQPLASLTKDEEDRLRREVFTRLARTDFRSLPQGSQLRLLTGGLADILAQISDEQTPNLVMASTALIAESRPIWRGHLLVWPSTPAS